MNVRKFYQRVGKNTNLEIIEKNVKCVLKKNVVPKTHFRKPLKTTRRPIESIASILGLINVLIKIIGTNYMERSRDFIRQKT